MPRIALYAHDTYGLGHLRRCLKLAGHLATHIDDLEVLIVTGSPWYGLFAVPHGVSLVALPPVVKTGPGTYESRDASSDLGAVLRERQRIIAGSIEPFRPHLLLVDNVPCGLLGEVLPVLRALKPRGSRLVLMLRDVLDRPETVQEEWQRAGAGEALEWLFDELWIFGEAEDAAMLARPHLLGPVADRLHICGRLPANGRSDRPDVALRRVSGPRPQVLVTGGGGGDAEPLVRTYLRALSEFRPAAASRVVLGPDFPAGCARRYVADARVRRFVPNLESIMGAADVIVAMAGYNTVCEVLESGRPAVLVPRRYPREEQWLRALRLQRTGRIELVDPAQLTPAALWGAVEAALEHGPYVPEQPPGARRAVRRAERLLSVALAEVGA